MTVPLKSAVENHLSDQKLSDTQLDALIAMQTTSVRRRFQTGKMIAVAAMVLIVIGVFFNQSPWQNQTLQSQIAQEVVKNHLKAKPLEVVSNEYGSVLSYFSALDFLPAIPNGLDSQFTLLGARYCSIQGESAAQIRYSDAHSQRTMTVYQVDNSASAFAPINALLDEQQPLISHAKGVEVTIWREKGVLFVQTAEPEQ